MRKNQRWLMILITIVIIVAFVFLYNRTELDKLGQTSVGSIYGKPVNNADFAREGRMFDVARELGMYDLLQTLVSDNRNPVEDYVWNTMVLRRQAELLQIAPSEDAVAGKIKELAPFQGENGFDLEKYNNFIANVLTPRGFSQSQLEDLIRDDLRIGKMRDLVGSATSVSEDEVRNVYGDAVRKRHLQMVKLTRPAAGETPTVTPEEIKAHFEKNAAQYQTPEKRAVKYVALELSEADKKLAGKEKVAALKPLSAKADAFSERLTHGGANFEAIAKELGLEIKTSAAFSQSEPPAEFAAIPQFAPAAFNLTTDAPDSDVLQTSDAFYLLHLEKIEPAQPQTLEQATAAITAQLASEKASAALQKRAAELRASLQESLKAGQTFTQAAEKAGVPVETIPPFSPAEEQQNQEPSPNRMIQATASRLPQGALTDLIATPDGGAFAYVEKIEPLDDAKWTADKETVVDRYSSSKREISFSEWFRAKRAAANAHSGGEAS